MEGIIKAWGRILAGYQPNLSIEITRECPLTCPGCYAYGSDHLGGDVKLRELQDFKGQQLVDAMFALLEKHKPLHVSIVGGEPLVRYRELNEILPRMADMGHLHAARHERRAPDSDRVGRPAPPADRRLDRRIAAGARRAPQARDLRSHPEAHRRARHPRALHGDAPAGAPRRLPRGVREILVGESDGLANLVQPLHAAGRRSVDRAPHEGRPPEGGGRPARASRRSTRNCARTRRCSTPTSCRRDSPDDCIFAKTTACVSANFEKPITPCQFGGNPDCTNCGCIASAALAAVGRHKLPGGIRVGTIFDASFEIGNRVRAVRESCRDGTALNRSPATLSENRYLDRDELS